MDSLTSIIKSYNEAEKQNLKKYITRKSNSFDRKDVLLLNLLFSDENYSSKEIAIKIYGYYKKDAYHQLRKSLYNQIENFELQQNTQNDIYHIITRQLTIAKYMLKKNLSRIGWKYLLNAELEAQKAEQFNLLNHIYFIQQENSYRDDAPDIYEIIQKRNKNIALANEDINLNIVLNILRHDFRQENFLQNENLDDHVDFVLKKYGIKKKIYQVPKLAYSIFAILATPMMGKKEYHKFEKFLIKVYNELDNKNTFKLHNHYEKLRMQQLIINIKTKLKKFKEAEYFTELFKKDILKYNGKHQHFILGFAPAIADLYNYQGKINEATEFLEKILDSSIHKLSDIEIITYQVNLASLYFQNKDFLAAKFALSSIENKNKLFKTRFGAYQLLVKYLTECIIDYELGEYDAIKEKCSFIKRNFRYEFFKPEYQREKTFISLLLQLNKNQQIIENSEFITDVKNFIKIKTFELGEIEVISFNEWLNSKIYKVDYYKIVLDTFK